MKIPKYTIAILFSTILAACGGGGSSSTQTEQPPVNPDKPVVPEVPVDPDKPVIPEIPVDPSKPQPPITPDPSANIFVAQAPYAPTIGNTKVGVDIGASHITYDFSGHLPFYNTAINRSDIHTVNTWNPATNSSQVVQGHSLTNSGIAGRLFRQDGYMGIGVIAGDGIVEEKLRTQVNAFPIPTRRHFLWELKFKVGGRTLGSPWRMAPAGESPATIWQLKTPSYGPTLLMGLDTDPKNPSKLFISFDSRVNPTQGGVSIGGLGNIDPAGENDVKIEAFLDEREASQGGKGFLKITVNGIEVVNKNGPVVQAGANYPYNWSMGMYLWKNTQPLSYDRFIYYKTARLINLD